MKKYCVYLHKNKINNKCYVGITSRKPRERWQYGNGYRKQPKFFNAILKYGWNNFEHIILEKDLNEDEALEQETYYIQKYNSIKNGYNILEQGQKSSPYCFQGIKIYCIENQTFYESIAEASRQLGFSNPGDIEKVIRGERNGCHNLHFLKAEEATVQNIKKILQKRTGKFRKVYCLETQQVFNSLQEAADFCNRSAQSVMLNCQGKRKKCGNYHFQYFEDSEAFQLLYNKITEVVNGDINLIHDRYNAEEN